MMELETEAIEFLLRETPDGETLFVGTSGGKDSIVTTDLVRRSGIPYELYHTLGGIDPPEVVRFLRRYYPETKYLRPRFSYWHNIQTKNPPLINARWCCLKMRKEPSYKVPHKYRVMGIRAEESSRRSKYTRVNYFEFNRYGRPEHYQLYPIFHWTEADLWTYIEKYNLPYPDLYDQGFDRIGCIICPYHTKAQHELYRYKYPNIFKLFEKVVGKWYSRRKASGRDMNNANASEFITDWYQGNASWYRRRKQ